MARVNKRILLAVAAVVVIAVFVVVNLKPKASSKGLDVKIEDVARRRIESWVRAPGKVQPVTKVQVSSNVMGRVIDLSGQGRTARREGRSSAPPR